MSKFEELCKSYKSSRNAYFEYRNRGFEFAHQLVHRYLQYLDIPEDGFKFIPLDEEPKRDSIYTIPGAMHLNDDSFWHLGLRITLYTAINEYPQQPVLIRFMFKEHKGGYLVKISDDDPGHLIQLGDDEQFLKFFDFLQKIIQDNFEKGLQKFLEESAPLRTIGFTQPSN